MIYVANGHIRGMEQLNFTKELRSKQRPPLNFEIRPVLFDVYKRRGASIFWQRKDMMSTS
jgi:hypothetical protein